MARRVALAVVLWAVVLGGMVAGARAHDDFEWINKGGYKAADGSHCCGKDDCVEIDPGAVRWNPETGWWDTPNGPVAPVARYQSENGRAYLCRFNKCLFVPGGG